MPIPMAPRSEEHTSELQSPCNLVCRLLLEKKKKKNRQMREDKRCGLDTISDAALVVLAHSRHSLPGPTVVHDSRGSAFLCFFFFFNDTATTEIYTLSLHDALPIWSSISRQRPPIRGTPLS